MSSVLVIAPGEVFGGAERQIVTFASWARQQDIRYRALLFHDSRLAQELRRLNFDVDVVTGGTLKTVSTIRRVVKTFDPSGVHVHGYRAAVSTALAVSATSRTFVSTQHGLAEAAPKLGDKIKVNLYQWLEFHALHHLNSHIVFVTEDLRQRVGSMRRIKNSRVIYNGINAETISTRMPSGTYRPECRNIVIVGRVERVKGIEVAIRSILNSRVPDDVVLHIVGDGDDRERLEQLSASLNIANRVHFHGFCECPYPYIAQAELVLMPSFHEGLPYTLLEAMLLKVPVIATSVGGLKEILSNDRHAILVPPNAADDLAIAIERILGDRELREMLIENAYALVTSDLSDEQMCRSYLELLAGKADNRLRQAL